MANCSTKYLGLDLKNPLIVASSNLGSDLEKIVKCQEAGAGAVVLKSLFEEQISHDSGKMLSGMNMEAHSDAQDFFSSVSKSFYMDNYLKLVEDAKKEVDIPIIASLNCVSEGNWISYASDFQKVGADALELNVFIIPADVKRTGQDIEKTYLNIARKVADKVSLPVSMKLGCHFSGMANMFKSLDTIGIKGLVLFNRFYKPDIDIERMKLIPAKIFSAPEEMALSLQWIALLSGELSCDFSAATGVHKADDVIKQLLAGAATTQLCSVLYKNGIEYISDILKDLIAWMDKHNFNSIDDFKGKLSQESSDNPAAYERSQYVKALVGIS